MCFFICIGQGAQLDGTSILRQIVFFYQINVDVTNCRTSWDPDNEGEQQVPHHCFYKGGGFNYFIHKASISMISSIFISDIYQ